MNFLKKHKNKIILSIVIAAMLVAAFLAGSNHADNEKVGDMVLSATESTEAEEEATEIEPESEEMILETESVSSKVQVIEVDEPVLKEDPPLAEQQKSVVADELTCTLSVRCDTVLQNMESLDSEKTELVPKDGVIFAEQTVTFDEGESVFDVLLREMKKNKIHMEFTGTPMYNSAYIEGINNLYEYDCGELSGWKYRVNGLFPNCGCSKYQLKDGDKIEWLYTCDMGADIGMQSEASGE